ncbi:hypothetical protein GDO78_010066 [Eleutherodactylus coqui]|uniref:Uncharacterized protein n=1 Tax=Eleutherodactylus coqui TaxID=57060 RepID=A0A8J6K9W6_ELECQ|nr:hypothetical protein GDO78_010066 [Eleutherodactylus coqui]
MTDKISIDNQRILGATVAMPAEESESTDYSAAACVIAALLPLNSTRGVPVPPTWAAVSWSVPPASSAGYSDIYVIVVSQSSHPHQHHQSVISKS